MALLTKTKKNRDGCEALKDFISSLEYKNMKEQMHEYLYL